LLYIPGEQLIFVQYMDTESPNPSNLTLDFFFDGGDRIRTITFVEFQEQSDSNFRSVTIYDGGAGNDNNFVKFSLGSYDATYYRVQSNFYGFYNEEE
jgi:hypothetical protein